MVTPPDLEPAFRYTVRFISCLIAAGLLVICGLIYSLWEWLL